MTNALMRRRRQPGSAIGSAHPVGGRRPDREALERLMTSFWAGRSPHTLAAYRSDLEQFCRYLVRACGLPPLTPQLEVLRVFFRGGAGRANQLVLDYRSDMKAVGKAPKTINRRLAAIRALVKLSRLIGMSHWSLEVEGVRSELTRDTRGPTTSIVAQLIGMTEDESPPLGPRNRALIHLLFDLGLRVQEVCRLDVADVDLTMGGLWVLGKGRTRKERLTMPAPTVEAVRGWLEVRGRHAGPLLWSYSKAAHADRRLVTRGAYRIIRNLGARAGIHLHPHMLRHSAITEAVERSVTAGLSLDQVRDFSRHKNINILLEYRDRLTNVQLRLATMVADSVRPTTKRSAE